MLTLRGKNEPSPLDPLIDDVIAEMKGYEATEAEYKKLLSVLRDLLDAKAAEPKPREISPDTMAIVAGNLLGVALVLLFETKGVINSRALNMIGRPKT